MNSRCSRCALFTSATVGCAMRASSAISPGWFMPSSITAIRWWRRRPSTVSGTPMWLFRLPAVAWAASPWAVRRMDATICVTVVLPLLPVTAISGSVRLVRQPSASACSARSVSGTSSPASPASASPRSAMAATAPAAPACGRKLWASKRSPRSATNRSPARRLRVSVWTRCSAVAGSPTSRVPGSRAATRAWASPRVMNAWDIVKGSGTVGHTAL